MVLIPAPATNNSVSSLFTSRGLDLGQRTVCAVQVGDTKDIGLAAKWCGERAADAALALDESGGVALCYCSSGGEAQESGEGGECELHFDGGWLIGLVWGL